MINTIGNPDVKNRVEDIHTGGEIQDQWNQFAAAADAAKRPDELIVGGQPVSREIAAHATPDSGVEVNGSVQPGKDIEHQIRTFDLKPITPRGD